MAFDVDPQRVAVVYPIGRRPWRGRRRQPRRRWRARPRSRTGVTNSAIAAALVLDVAQELLAEFCGRWAVAVASAPAGRRP
jgi:hypothetical protein